MANTANTFLTPENEFQPVSEANPLPTTGNLKGLTDSNFKEIMLVMLCTLDEINIQLKLLNARTEEGFQTYITEKDL